MLIERSILSFIAATTATQCSAALPTIATTNMPMKNCEMPSSLEACSTEPTSVSLATATSTAAAANTQTARLTLQWAGESPGGFAASRCARNETVSPAPYATLSATSTVVNPAPELLPNHWRSGPTADNP